MKKELLLNYKNIPLIILISFCTGFLSKNFVKKLYYKSYSEFQEFYKFKVLNKYKNCTQEIKDVPNNSLIIIGHAYGNPNSNNDNISPKIQTFYNLHKEKINTIVFSGDIIKEPTLDRWELFYSLFDKKKVIYIAPGNHDVGISQNARRDIFNIVNHRNQSNIKYPFSFRWENSLFIIEDSTIPINPIKSILPIIKKSSSNENIYIIRHHVLPSVLKFTSNTKKSVQGFLKEEEFKDLEDVIEKRKITFIYGDGGASKDLPRISCYKKGNIKHIVNGIGEFDGDLVLIVKNNQIYSKNLDK